MARAFKKLFRDRIKLATATAGKRGLSADVIQWADSLIKRRIAGESDSMEYGGGKYAGDNLADYVDFVGVCALGYAQGKYTEDDVHHMVVKWMPGTQIEALETDADSGEYWIVMYAHSGEPVGMERHRTKHDAQRTAKRYLTWRSPLDERRRSFKKVVVYSPEQVDAMGGIGGVIDAGRAAAGIEG